MGAVESLTGPKILAIDIETTPILGYTWGMYQTNVLHPVKDFTLLCYAYQWVGDDDVLFARKKRGNGSDRELARSLYRLLDEADIVVAHNADRFDIRKIQARLVVHGLNRPSFFQTVDTLKVTRRNFGFGSNRLKHLAETFDLPRKLENRGFALWLEVMADDPDAWAEMESYNVQDVVTLVALYRRLLPWIDNHPNLGHWADTAVCKACGSADLVRRGWALTRAGRYQRFRCLTCGSWSQSPRRSDAVPVLR
jgi:DNA polymerase elongation subunit (family B)